MALKSGVEDTAQISLHLLLCACACVCVCARACVHACVREEKGRGDRERSHFKEAHLVLWSQPTPKWPNREAAHQITSKKDLNVVSLMITSGWCRS